VLARSAPDRAFARARIRVPRSLPPAAVLPRWFSLLSSSARLVRDSRFPSRQSARPALDFPRCAACRSVFLVVRCRAARSRSGFVLRALSVVCGQQEQAPSQLPALGPARAHTVRFGFGRPVSTCDFSDLFRLFASGN
jgi:hypothetical protein